MPTVGQRVALLIGAQDYPHLGSLRTPVQDVRLIRSALRRCGFSDDRILTLVSEPERPVTASDMRRALSRFGQALRDFPAPGEQEHSCGLLYYAGHGITHRGEGVLLSDLAGFAPADLDAEGISLSEVARQCGVRLDIPVVMFIDACRSLSRASGLELAPLRLPPVQMGDMVIDLATGPGEVAIDGIAHSPYAAALSKAMPMPGHSIGDMLIEVRAAVRHASHHRQSPQTVSSLSTRLMLVPELTAAPVDHRQHEPMPALGATRAGHLAPRRNFSDEEIRRMGHLIHKLKAKDSTGRWAYYFVLVEEHFEQGFLASIDGEGTVDLEHYGTVIASCYGEEPTAEVSDYLRHRFGFDVRSKPTLLPALWREEPRPAKRLMPIPMPPSQPEQAMPAAPPLPVMAALRQHTGLNQWRWLVLLLTAGNQEAFFREWHAWSDMDRSGIGADGRGWLGGLRKAVDAMGGSVANIDRFAAFGMVVARGNGSHIPLNTLTHLQTAYHVMFDWRSWEHDNIALAYFAQQP